MFEASSEFDLYDQPLLDETRKEENTANAKMPNLVEKYLNRNKRPEPAKQESQESSQSQSAPNCESASNPELSAPEAAPVPEATTVPDSAAPAESAKNQDSNTNPALDSKPSKIAKRNCEQTHCCCEKYRKIRAVLGSDVDSSSDSETSEDEPPKQTEQSRNSRNSQNDEQRKKIENDMGREPQKSRSYGGSDNRAYATNENSGHRTNTNARNFRNSRNFNNPQNQGNFNNSRNRNQQPKIRPFILCIEAKTFPLERQIRESLREHCLENPMSNFRQFSNEILRTAQNRKVFLLNPPHQLISEIRYQMEVRRKVVEPNDIIIPAANAIAYDSFQHLQTRILEMCY